MTEHHHLRAAIRWFLPWDEDTRLRLCCAGVLAFLMAVASIPWDGLEIAWMIAELGLYIGLGCAAWHMLQVVGVALLDFQQYRDCRVTLRLLWRQLGELPLAPTLQERLADYLWRRQMRSGVLKE